MKIIQCEQGTPEWFQARLGIPTCSRLDEVLTPKTLKLSTPAGKYRNQLLAEWLVGYPLDFGGSSAFVPAPSRTVGSKTPPSTAAL